jgi:hypothetical protein
MYNSPKMQNCVSCNPLMTHDGGCDDSPPCPGGGHGGIPTDPCEAEVCAVLYDRDLSE